MSGPVAQGVPAAGLRWLMGGLVVVALPHLFRMPLPITLFCLAMLALRLLHDLGGWRLPGRWGRMALTLTGVGTVLASHHTVIGYGGGSALLAVMLCLKPLELRTLRDAMVAVLLGYFLLITGFLVDQSLASGVYMLVAIVLQTAALVALHHPPDQGRGGRRYLGRSARLVGQALPVMLVLYLFFPRISGPLWGMPEDGGGTTGLSDELTMGSISSLVESDAVAFRVQFDGETPAADELYWRGPVLWRSDGRHWETLPGTVLREFHAARPLLEPNGAPVRYAIVLEPHEHKYLLSLDLPRGPAEGGILALDYQMFTPETVSTQRRYRLTSHTRYTTGRSDRRILRLATELPPDSNPRSHALARRWRTEEPSAAAVVERALDHFRERPFYYSRNPPPLQGDVVDQFLFETRTGFCEHFAASFTTLMRAAGIPARVVTGYQGGEKSAIDDYLIVRQSDAHAWAEVHLAGAGWVRIDPTSVIPPERVLEPADLQRFRSTAPRIDFAAQGWVAGAWRVLRHGWDAIDYQWTLWVIGYSQERQRRLLEALGLEKWGWQGLALLLGGGVAAVLGLLTLLLLRLPRSRDPVVRAYRRFTRKVAKSGIRPKPSEGPVDFARRAAAALPRHAHEIGAITRLYAGIRYGHLRRERVAELKQRIGRLRI